MGLFFQFDKLATFQIRKLSNSRNKKKSDWPIWKTIKISNLKNYQIFSCSNNFKKKWKNKLRK